MRQNQNMVLNMVSKLTILTAVLVAIFMTTLNAYGQAQQVLIEVNNTATDQDDYLCWSPVLARAKLVSPTPSPVQVRLVSQVNPPAGSSVHFQADGGSRPTVQTFAPQSELRLALGGDGGWTSFWVAGARASSGGKDVRLVALDAAGAELGQLPVMVRVRKNAETLTNVESQQLLRALSQVHDLANSVLNSQWTKHVRAHAEAFNFGIHGAPSGTPLFLAWHRAFLLHLERELQAVDPRVALPYWRFDQAAPRLFSPDFLGAVTGQGTLGAGFLVQFSSTNPLFGWHMGDNRGGLVRARNGAMAGPLPASRLDDILNAPLNGTYGVLNGALEGSYHNGAHSTIAGWLGSAASPRDPLFFFLHANVDRAWAHWQARFNKFDPHGTDTTAYSALGQYPGPSTPTRFRKGSYAKDAMWPWSGPGGDQGTPDPNDDWPGLAYPLPPGNGPAGLVLPPTPASQVDYLDVHGQGHAHGSCYDDIDFWGRAITP
jgi:tyrosinase